MSENYTLQQLRLDIIEVKYKLAAMYNDASIIPRNEDFDDLIRLQEELKYTTTITKSLLEKWIAKKLR